MPITKVQVLTQLHSLRHTGLFDLLYTAAAALNAKLPPAYLLGIASRETNCQNILGDYRAGEFHGVGVMQIDIQHPIARAARDDGSYLTQPAPLIQFGVQLLSNDYTEARKRFPQFKEAQWLKIAASGYNCGIGTAIAATQNGDSDQFTTGKNYGRDVMTRMAIFEELLVEGA